jgi:hypothetical protein
VDLVACAPSGGNSLETRDKEIHRLWHDKFRLSRIISSRLPGKQEQVLLEKLVSLWKQVDPRAPYFILQDAAAEEIQSPTNNETIGVRRHRVSEQSMTETNGNQPMFRR